MLCERWLKDRSPFFFLDQRNTLGHIRRSSFHGPLKIHTTSKPNKLVVKWIRSTISTHPWRPIIHPTNDSKSQLLVNSLILLDFKLKISK